MSSITSAPTTWDPAELAGYAANYPDVSGINLGAISKYNPTPGTCMGGRDSRSSDAERESEEVGDARPAPGPGRAAKRSKRARRARREGRCTTGLDRRGPKGRCARSVAARLRSILSWPSLDVRCLCSRFFTLTPLSPLSLSLLSALLSALLPLSCCLGTGRTGYLSVPPNNYPFYSESEKYTPIVQADGGQLSEWQPMYNPTQERAEADRKLAYETGVPHGYRAPGAGEGATDAIALTVVSELHDADEYGADIDAATGRHSGGPFEIKVSPAMRIEELRSVIYRVGGILPALQKLSYAGKNFEDSQRTLEQYEGDWKVGILEGRERTRDRCKSRKRVIGGA